MREAVTQTVTLSDVVDAWNFRPGMRVMMKMSPTGALVPLTRWDRFKGWVVRVLRRLRILRPAPSYRVVAIDHGAGTITLDGPKS